MGIEFCKMENLHYDQTIGALVKYIYKKLNIKKRNKTFGNFGWFPWPIGVFVTPVAY